MYIHIVTHLWNFRAVSFAISGHGASAAGASRPEEGAVAFGPR